MRVGFSAFLCVFVLGCNSASGHEAPTPEEALVARGREVYKEQSCGVCHTLTDVGTGGVFGPPHDSVGTVAARRIKDPAYKGAATTVDGYLRESIQNPTAFRVPGYEHTRFAMPAYTGLSPQDLDALVAMLKTEKGRH